MITIIDSIYGNATVNSDLETTGDEVIILNIENIVRDKKIEVYDPDLLSVIKIELDKIYENVLYDPEEIEPEDDYYTQKKSE